MSSNTFVVALCLGSDIGMMSFLTYSHWHLKVGAVVGLCFLIMIFADSIINDCKRKNP